MKSVKNHLTTNGKFIVDIFNPSLELLNRNSEKKYPFTEIMDPQTGGKDRDTGK
ncbi:MAG: hypothetical protein ACOCRX_05820 [Candidatus Woesearchaeota archaeon]